jgi:hypothetical protein
LPTAERTLPNPQAPAREVHDRPRLHDDSVIRATAIVGLGTVAVIHVAQIVPTAQQTPWLGAGFGLLVASCVALAAVLLHRGHPRLWAAISIVNVLAIAGYAVTRLVSTPIDNQDVGNWSENLGVAALFAEGALVLLGLHVLTGIPARAAQRSPTIEPR